VDFSLQDLSFRGISKRYFSRLQTVHGSPNDSAQSDLKSDTPEKSVRPAVEKRRLYQRSEFKESLKNSEIPASHGWLAANQSRK